MVNQSFHRIVALFFIVFVNRYMYLRIEASILDPEKKRKKILKLKIYVLTSKCVISRENGLLYLGVNFLQQIFTQFVMGPNRPKVGQKGPQMGPKWIQKGLKWAQSGSKSGPKGVQMKWASPQ